MVLGDNIFAGLGLRKRLLATVENVGHRREATIFEYYVDDPEQFEIVEFDHNGKAISIEEKSQKSKSNYYVTEICFYDDWVVDYAKALKPSDVGN